MMEEKSTLSVAFRSLLLSLILIAILVLELARDDPNGDLILLLTGASTMILGVALVLISGTPVVTGVKYTDDNELVRVSMILGGVYILVKFAGMFSIQGIIESLGGYL